MKPGGKHTAKHRVQHGLSLSKFATAKSSKFDKRKKLEKERALKANRYNKYQKLKAKLQNSGKLQPTLAVDLVSEEDVRRVPKRTATERHVGKAEEDVSRAMARAGPAPDSDNTSDEDELEPPSFSGRPSESALEDKEQTEGRQLGNVRQPKRLRTQMETDTRRESEGPPRQPPHKKKHSIPKQPTSIQRTAAEVEAKKDAIRLEKEAAQRAAEERRQRIAAVQAQRKQQTQKFRKVTRHGQPVMKFRMEKILSSLEADR